MIIEDELPAQGVLRNYLARLPEMELLGCYQSALEAHTQLKTGRTDLLFLDIELPNISGMDYLKTLNNPPKVIMTTAYPQYAVASYDMDMIIDYLVKPFSFERFLKAVNRAEGSSKKTIEPKVNSEITPESIFINVDKQLHKIRFKDLLVVSSERNYVSMQTTAKKYAFLGNLKDWKEKLPVESFLQIHRSFMINYKQIDGIKNNHVLLGNYKIPIGRKYKGQLLKTLGVFDNE
jgi:DNA-binding LytR/AlgR family response regulator